ncbi:MAG: hypothetical protein QM669_01105 [Siphonobacter sp.]
MKKLLVVLGLLAGTGVYQTSSAQLNVSVNISTQPIWGPTGYDYAQYYYLPDLDIYYDIPQKQWIYLNGRQWITASTLPPRYRNYDLYSAHKVVINESKPYLRNNRYRKQYAQFKGRHDQVAIRDSRESKYYVNPQHPKYSQQDNRGGNDHRGNDHNTKSGKRTHSRSRN